MNTRNKDAGPVEESVQSASPWVSKSFVFGAGFIIAIIVALAFVLASVWGKSPASVTSSTQSGENASTAADNAPPACELGVTGMKPLTAPPASVDASFVGVTVASTAHAGPSRTTDGLPTCYEHSTEGAVLAGANFLRLQSQYADQMKLYTTLVAPSDVRTAALEDMRAAGGSMRGWSSDVVVIKGVYTEVWSDDIVFMSYAVSIPSQGPQTKSIQFKMTWSEGDWKVELPENGFGVSVIDSPASMGMLEWRVPVA